MSTESHVIALLDTLAAANEEIPTIRDIRQRIGKGSLTTISRAVQDWKLNHRISTGIVSEIPDELTEVISSKILNSIWAGVRPLLMEQIAAQKHVCDAQMIRLRHDLRDAEGSLAKSEARRAELEKEVAELKAELREALLARAKAEGALEAFQSLKER